MTKTVADQATKIAVLQQRQKNDKPYQFHFALLRLGTDG